jgi:hypothetical protein
MLSYILISLFKRCGQCGQEGKAWLDEWTHTCTAYFMVISHLSMKTVAEIAYHTLIVLLWNDTADNPREFPYNVESN